MKYSDLPSLREDLDLCTGPKSHYGVPTWTLHDPVRNRFFRIGWLQFELLARWQKGSVAAILNDLRQTTSLQATERHVHILAGFLCKNHLVIASHGAGEQALRQKLLAPRQGWLPWLLMHYLFLRIPLFRPDRFLEMTLPVVRLLFTRGFVKALILCAVIGLYLISRQWDSFVSTFLYFFSFEGLVYYAVAIVLAKIIHEFGHAYTAKLYGLSVPTMGIAFLVLWPVLYTDSSSAWKLTQSRQRLAIGAAGMIAELGLASLATLIWSFLPDGTMKSAVFLIATTTWVITLFVNLNPFMRFDGYYLLSDYLMVPNLQDRAFALGRWLLRKTLLGIDVPPPEMLPTHRRRLLITYAYACWCYRLVLFIGIALMVYYLFFKLLGIILMVLELVWFIAVPVFNEMRAWWLQRSQIASNKQVMTSALVVVLMLALLFVPLHVTVFAPAMLQPKQSATIYPPASGIILELPLTVGQLLAANATVVRIGSPELQFKKTFLGYHIHALELKLRRRANRQKLLEATGVLQKQYAQALAEAVGHEEKLQQLHLRAPFAGEVLKLAEGYTVGSWINETEPLILLANRQHAVVVAYLHEADVKYVRAGMPAVFYAEDPEISKIELLVVSIDEMNTKSLQEPFLVSSYGGALPVRSQKNDKWHLYDTRYRVVLKPIDASFNVKQMLRGEVRMQGQQMRWITRIWRHIIAVILRESGF